MNAEQRQAGIVAAVMRDGRVHVNELAVHYDVTVETCRSWTAPAPCARSTAAPSPRP